MSLATDSNAAFDSMAALDSGTLILGTRQPCKCILPAGIVWLNDLGRGSVRAEVAVQVMATQRDIGEPPRSAEKASLNYHGKSYNLAVSEDDVTSSGGAIYNFTLAG